MNRFNIREVSPPSLTVSQFTRQIKTLIEEQLPQVWLQGELSNFVHHSSGHMYFSLKDENATISCVMWRSRNSMLFFTPQDGMQLLLLGQATVYEKRGVYQFDVAQMVPAGIGQLQLAFDKLKARLHGEGLFDPARKRPLPPFPERIGLVTSPTGAAIRDLVHVARRRMPSIQLVLRPALVQGEGAAQDIAAAIAELNDWGEVDVIIIGRGGGSLEDLWAFNEEIVARAIYASRIPVVSAVGHEIDYTIADFVADLRAPTPSAAAELVVPESAELRSQLAGLWRFISQSAQRRLGTERLRLRALQHSYGFRRPLDVVRQRRQRLDELDHRRLIALQSRLARERSRAATLAQRCQDLAPESILKRGYAICWRGSERRFLRSAAELEVGETVHVQLARDRFSSRVVEIQPGMSVMDNRKESE